ncbi:hypothetical protein B0H16DRAFT_1451008 [Mycena metata]|uniref:Uncharacterized protein n=1 Tax=Mycena metata TaxID=1033252 RepID=A0AAD7NS17_9AGAR|nr:hypothetical protein B0H16DRAFT_1451008 [Mycena metata]
MLCMVTTTRRLRRRCRWVRYELKRSWAELEAVVESSAVETRHEYYPHFTGIMSLVPIVLSSGDVLSYARLLLGDHPMVLARFGVKWTDSWVRRALEDLGAQWRIHWQRVASRTPYGSGSPQSQSIWHDKSGGPKFTSHLQEFLAADGVLEVELAPGPILNVPGTVIAKLELLV